MLRPRLILRNYRNTCTGRPAPPFIRIPIRRLGHQGFINPTKLQDRISLGRRAIDIDRVSRSPESRQDRSQIITHTQDRITKLCIRSVSFQTQEPFFSPDFLELNTVRLRNEPQSVLTYEQSKTPTVNLIKFNSVNLQLLSFENPLNLF